MGWTEVPDQSTDYGDKNELTRNIPWMHAESAGRVQIVFNDLGCMLIIQVPETHSEWFQF